VRISWLSNAPWSFTGYGNQTKLFTPRIKDLGHDVSIQAFYGHEGSPINWGGIPVYGRGLHPYGQDIMAAHSKNFNADIMISLMDAWVIQPELLQSTKWVPWFPIDHEPMPLRVADPVSKAYKRIVFSHFGEHMMDGANLEYYYVPHGVDTKMFKPVDRKEARERMRLPDDRFIVGMVAANKGYPPRKAFFENIAAFTYLKEKHPDALLYLHTYDGSHGGEAVNLVDYVKYQGLKIGKDVIFAEQYMYMVGYPDEAMNDLYNSFDVHMLVSAGEGFGIPILEAQASGCPVVVGDWTSMSELCFSGWKVSKKDANQTWTLMNSYQFTPHVGAIADHLESAYRQKDNEALRRDARAGALPYDADIVTERYWKPVLEDISNHLELEKEESLQAIKSLKALRHEHKWGTIGFYIDGVQTAPCTGCDDGLTGKGIVKDAFAADLDLDLVEDTDGISRIVSYEIKHDYKLDDLNLTGTVIDIGAHKGIVSCYIAKKYPNVKVLAYEPVKENYEAMLENIHRNNIKNVIPHNLAVTSDGRDVKIYTDPINNSGGSSLYGEGNYQKVRSTTLADIFAKHKIDRVSLLKVDCEGAEFEILDTPLLEKVDRLRGEFHKSKGDMNALVDKMTPIIPDVVITLQG